MKEYKLLEELDQHTLVLSPLQYEKDELHPVISTKTIEAHYEVHTKNYFQKQHEQPFFKAGAFLHEHYWKQFHSTSNYTEPNKKTTNLIQSNFESFMDLKEKFNEQCNKVQGSGWIYLSKNGKIKTIIDHEIKHDILILQDCWEHAYYIDYGPNKSQYFEDFWEILNWNFFESLL